MSKPEWEPFRVVLALALSRMIGRLKEAQDYLVAGKDSAMIGTLIDLDELHRDLEAALRLFKSRRFP